jgi:hypothetical protein
MGELGEGSIRDVKRPGSSSSDNDAPELCSAWSVCLSFCLTLAPHARPVVLQQEARLEVLSG